MEASSNPPAFLFDLDGTLVDSVYQHVLAWREALERSGIELAVWRIHRRIGMSGGLLVNALLRETGHPVTSEQAEQLPRFHAEAYGRMVAQVRPLPGASELPRKKWRPVGHRHQRSGGKRASHPESSRNRSRSAACHARSGAPG